MTFTAKVYCQSKQQLLGSNNPSATLTFAPDYADGRNKEWADATPALHLTMTVKPSVAEQVNPGGKYTLTFEAEDA